ncbi:condensation domain-containing protein, partial [Paenibacillus sp. YSY-4.3]
SLKAIMLLAKLQKKFEVDLPLQVLFDHPTIEELAQYIGQSVKVEWAAIQKVEARDYYPVTSIQRRMYALSQLEGAKTIYNMPGAVKIMGSLDTFHLEKVLQQLIERHESLRTTFTWIDGNLVQQVHEKVDFAMAFEECSEEQVAAVMDQFVVPFELTKAPLLRVKLIKLSDQLHLMLFDMHHMIADGVSLSVFVEEFMALFEGRELEPLRIHYKDVAVWQEAYQQTEAYRNHENFWLDCFKDGAPVLNLPADYVRPANQSFMGDRVDFKLDGLTFKKMHRLSRETGATMYMILLSAFYVLLAKYTGQEDVVIGSTIAGRNHADLSKIIGVFINALALRNEPKGSKTFHSFLVEVKENTLRAYEHQAYPFEELVEKLDFPRDVSRNPLFDTMLVLHNHYDLEDHELGVSGAVSFEAYDDVKHRISKFDLTVVVTQLEEEFMVSLEYCTELFKRTTIERIASHFQHIIELAVTKPGIKISDMELLLDEEKAHVLGVFNATQEGYPREAVLHKLVEASASANPAAEAVRCED